MNSSILFLFQLRRFIESERDKTGQIAAELIDGLRALPSLFDFGRIEVH
jgi:hypothetical protein